MNAKFIETSQRYSMKSSEIRYKEPEFLIAQMRLNRGQIQKFKRKVNYEKTQKGEDTYLINRKLLINDAGKQLKRISYLKRAKPEFNEAEKEEITNFGKELYSDPDYETNERPILDMHNTPSLDEIKLAIASSGNNKATGPDNSPIDLIKQGEDHIAIIIHKLMTEIGNSQRIPKDMNQAHIILIPKTTASKKPNDMRPITLLTTTYKILDKIIAKRLENELTEEKKSCIIHKLALEQT